MKLKQIHLTALLLTSSAVLSTAEPSDLLRWKDDFSDSAAFAKHWSSYGFLAAGIDAKNPLGKPVGGKDSRPEWWQVVDGTLRGQNFPEEKHGSGISRNVAGQDMRLSCRFKIPPGGMAAPEGLAGGGGTEEEGRVESAVLLREDGEDLHRTRCVA
jgi:hypothetical protein